ncbi:MAG TPA: PKD domain-containing protein, partial [Thermoplasmatales archaeon]|nr:PKD domain-containing protein [Thermoplasmatales archaeon]
LNTPPVADFSWLPLQPTDMDEVIFSDLSYDLDGYIANYTWQFGDGSIAYGKNVTHMYLDDGTYYVNLTITDDDGATANITKVIIVKNVPPVANFSFSPEEINTSDVIQFNDLSYDLDGYIANYTWQFGDGSIAYGKNVTHMYLDDGTYYVNLTITDGDGATANITKVIIVKNVPPVADFSWLPLQPTDMDEVIFSDLSYDLDGYIANYTWQFGDGSIAYGKNVTHMYLDDGTYYVNLTITDDDGATANITKVIIVKNVPPVADFVYLPEKPTDLDVIQFTSTSYDGDGYIVNYTWNFGNGNISYVANPTHKYPNNAVYMVTLIVKDDDGEVSEITKSILIENVPPVANFSFSPSQPTDLQSITFKSNSYDLDGYILNYTWDFGDGNFTYGLNTTLYKYADNGNYTVKLIVRDDDDATSEMKVFINVSNVAPTALFVSKPTKPRQKEKVVFDATSSYDPDGYIVNYSWDFDSNGVIDAYGIKAEYRYEKKGDYLATLTVTDNDGAKDSYQILVSVREKEKIPGFELIIIIMASAILISMKRYRKGIWRI